MTGCSSKYPSMKTGAIIGGATGVLTAVVIGTKDTNSDHASAIVIAAVILSLVTSAVGAGIGYAVDVSRVDKEMQEMIKTEQMISKQ